MSEHIDAIDEQAHTHADTVRDIASEGPMHHDAEHLVPNAAPAHELSLDAPALPRKSLASKARSFIGPFAVFVLFLVFWEFMHRWGMRHILDKRPALLPSPLTVVHISFGRPSIRRQLIGGLGWTSYAAFVGLGVTIVIGMTLAVIMAQAAWVERSIYPYLVALQATPVLAIVPIIYSIFGGGMASRIYVCVMISIFPVVTNTLFGLTSVDSSQHDLFTLRKASNVTRMMKLQFPAAMPSIFTGFRISAGLSVIGAIVGEQFFAEGEQPGIGTVMDLFRTKLRYPAMYGGLLVAAALGISVFFAFNALGKLIVGHWHESTRRS
jgi:NitT/TauT family transport system permease protein